jgi:glycosyltransferase involved in cell wall biosynthesis
MTPQISLGLPIWNGENHVEACLQNLQAQTFGDFELFIADNCSTDRTFEIVQDVAATDRRIRCYRQPENLGAARNYNDVFARAQAPYFKWVAHDDLCAPEYLETTYDILRQQPDVVLAHARSRLIDADGNALLDDDVDAFIDWAGTLRSAHPAPDRATGDTPYDRFRSIVTRTTRAFDIFGLLRTGMVARSQLHAPYYGSDIMLLAEFALYGKFYEHPSVMFYKRETARQSRSIKTKHERDKWIDPKVRIHNSLAFGRRTRSMLAAITNAPIGMSEKAKCYALVIGNINWLAPLRLAGVKTVRGRQLPPRAKVVDIRERPTPGAQAPLKHTS